MIKYPHTIYSVAFGKLLLKRVIMSTTSATRFSFGIIIIKHRLMTPYWKPCTPGAMDTQITPKLTREKNVGHINISQSCTGPLRW